MFERERKKSKKEKHQFNSHYCEKCKQRKSCGKLNEKKRYCCPCYQALLEELEWDKLLISSSQQTLNDYRLGAVVCECLESEKTRIKYVSSDGSGWIACQGCQKIINGAGHHGVIKNRNSPRFWGLEVSQKVLCGDCLKNLVGQMPVSKKYTFNKYVKRGCWG